MKTNSYLIATLGCKANLSDSLDFEATLQKKGWKKSTDGAADLCIINSCTVTDEADRQSRKMASKLARKNPMASIVITGCAAEVNPEKLLNTKGLHYVVGNQNKTELVDLVLERRSRDLANLTGQKAEILGSVQNYGELLSRHPIDREWNDVSTNLRPLENTKTRAFFKIQEGCNSFCTYCIIPYGRGPSRSLGIDEIQKQVRQIEESGIREIVITGTNLGDYGTDFEERNTVLEDAIQTILDSSRNLRVRLSSLDPTEITPRLIEMVRTQERLCPHFHVSLQSPINKILRLMKRKYTEAQIESTLQAIASISRDCFVGMDVITGFPGESQDDFEEGFEKLSLLPWTRLHVFPYSERAGTPATRLKDSVPNNERKSRTQRLNDLSMKRLEAHYQKFELRGVSDILVEEGNQGYTSNYLKVKLSAPTMANTVVMATNLTTQTDHQRLDACLIQH